MHLYVVTSQSQCLRVKCEWATMRIQVARSGFYWILLQLMWLTADQINAECCALQFGCIYDVYLDVLTSSRVFFLSFANTLAGFNLWLLLGRVLVEKFVTLNCHLYIMYHASFLSVKFSWSVKQFATLKTAFCRLLSTSSGLGSSSRVLVFVVTCLLHFLAGYSQKQLVRHFITFQEFGFLYIHRSPTRAHKKGDYLYKHLV